MIIRLFQFGDIETRVRWMNLPQIYANMGFTPPITIENTIAWYSKNLTSDNRIDVTYCDDNGDILGFGGVTQIDWDLGRGETYTFISPDKHHLGLGTKGNQLLIYISFRLLCLNKLSSHVDGPNIASRRVREKLGFKLEGVIRDEKRLNGELIDRYYYGLLNREYKPPKDITDTQIRITNVEISKLLKRGAH